MKRKRTYGKRSFKRRRVMRGRSRRFKGRRGRTPVHHFRRMCGTITFAGNAAFAPWTSGYTNKLADVIGPSEFTNLFDQYRLNKVVHKVWLSIDPSAQAAATSFYPRMFWVIDHDDAAVPSTVDELRQYGNCKTAVLKPDRPITIVYRPSILANMFSSIGVDA